MRFDYVIVGAGTAGCVLASRLSERPDVRVALLEAGSRSRRPETMIPAAFHRLYRTSLDWGYDTVPQAALDGRRVVFPRGRAVGGCATLNAMMVLRGHARDHDEWGVPGFSAADLAPHYEASGAGPFRHELAAKHPLSRAFLASAVAAGLRTGDGLNAPDNEAVGLVPTSTRRGRRFSVAHGYLAPALRRRNLTLLTGATATRIVLERGRARGVEILLDGHPETAVAEREVILAAGAVDSPKLLLLSGVGPADELERHGVERHVTSPGVGANLQDHLACGLLCDTRGAGTLAGADRPRHLLRWLLTGKGPLASNVAEAAAFVRSDPSLPAPDLELIFAPVLFENEGLTRPTEHGITLAVIPLQPHSRGTVALASSDPRAAPLVDPCYLSDSRDLRAMLQGLRLARRVTAAEPLAGLLAREREPGADALEDADLHAHVRRRAQTLYHPVGTCRAGTDDESVVDPLLRVRGVATLRVVDASIFPKLPRGHTNWPVVAVAERAAELVAAAA